MFTCCQVQMIVSDAPLSAPPPEPPQPMGAQWAGLGCTLARAESSRQQQTLLALSESPHPPVHGLHSFPPSGTSAGGVSHAPLPGIQRGGSGACSSSSSSHLPLIFLSSSSSSQQDFMEMHFCSCSRCMLISLRLLLLVCTCPAGPHKQLVHAGVCGVK